jgi:hypothetical protein
MARYVLLKDWPGKRDAANTGRPWFDGELEVRKFVSTVSRIMSGNCTARSHLSRFGFVERAICTCLKDYETVDHLLWYC